MLPSFHQLSAESKLPAEPFFSVLSVAVTAAATVIFSCANYAQLREEIEFINIVLKAKFFSFVGAHQPTRAGKKTPED